MRRKRLGFAAGSLAVLAVSLLAVPAVAAPPGDKITVISSGSSTLQGPASQGADGVVSSPEWRGPKRLGKSPLRTDPISAGPDLSGAGQGVQTAGAKETKSNPELLASWEGVNHRDSRNADAGNQFSGEPPDQGLCAGNGYVLETVNSALRVYDQGGTPLTPVRSLNQFYGFPPAINRTTGAFGPFTFDISCHFDPATNRWFHLAVDLDQNPATGAFTGKNYLDLAVSNSGDPTGTWTIYRIPGINDGTEGTPDHDCAGGPCFADFPHIGVDAHGVYITTNEFPLFEDGFTGAQIYALSKSQLVSTPLSIGVHLFNTADDPVRPDEPGFTVWPALSPGSQFDLTNGGTEHFVSSNAVFDDANADSTELIHWKLTNTSSLDSATPSLSLTKRILTVNRYAVPSNVGQKPGPFPLGQCLSDETLPTPFRPSRGCWRWFLASNPPDQILGTLDAGDSRVLDVRYANGRVWAVLGTAVEFSGTPRVGVGWYIISPGTSSVDLQGVLALEDESLTYPALGVTTSGRGVLTFTRVSESLHPSAGYASIDALAGAGDVKMAEEGDSTQDGFTEYPPIGGNRPRWGDYSAAAVDGSLVFVASEYIEQDPCTVAQYAPPPTGTGNFTCGSKRSSLANWSTRVSKLKP